MKIRQVETFHADGGGRNFDFLKITTADGLVGWSEYNESWGGAGISAVIHALGESLTGRDPRAYEAVVSYLRSLCRPAPSGIAHQAIGAIENALLDLTAKDIGIPVFALFGGPTRDQVNLYWSHCGTYRLNSAEVMHLPRIRDSSELSAVAREVRDNRFSALKTNVFTFDAGPRVYFPGFGLEDGFPDRNPDKRVIRALRSQLDALRQGVGDDVEILLDLNFNFRTEGFVQVARSLADYDLFWLEIDTYDPRALRYIRDQCAMPVASGECLYGRREYQPFFELSSFDVAIVDVALNGLAESVKIANAAETYETNVAPHNFYGPLATIISAHFCTCITNMRIMEFDGDRVPWYWHLVTAAPPLENGALGLLSGPGWGADVNEAALLEHGPAATASA